MQSFSNTNRSDGEGDESGEVDASQQATSGKQYYKDLIKKANSVPLKALFKLYSIKVDEHNKSSIICPFPNHKGKNYGGRERSPSFYYYPDTNSFFCFGCNIGGKDIGKAAMFVSNMDNTSLVNAAYKVLDLFDSENDDTHSDIVDIDHNERLEILMEFANCIRDFLQENLDDPQAIIYIENISRVFDRHYSKRDLDNKRLRFIISKLDLQDKIKLYKSYPFKIKFTKTSK